MSDIFAMRRANGDWFAVESHDRMRVPLFHSSHDAIMARFRNFGMLLFQPVALDPRLLKQIAGSDGGSYVDFSMVNDPFASLTRGKPVELAEIEVTLTNPVKPATAGANGNGFRDPEHLPRLSEMSGGTKNLELTIGQF